MRQILTLIFVLSASFIFAQCNEVWNQAPDPFGADVQCISTDIADDFTVASDTYICAIHFWLSWMEDNVGDINFVYAAIYSDVPAGVDLPWSHPGIMLWDYIFLPADITSIDGPFVGDQSFYDPLTPSWIEHDHTGYYEVNLGDCDQHEYISGLTTPFHALSGQIYWLVIHVEAIGGVCGWKTSLTDFNDSAVYYDNVEDFRYEPIGIVGYDLEVNLAFRLCGCDSETCPVELASFNAAVTQNNFVQLSWITESESDLLGYNVLRSETSSLEDALTINARYIEAYNSTAQSTYDFTDSEVEMNHTYRYWLESVEANGSSQFHGPVTVEIIDGEEDNPPDPVDSYALFQSVSPNPFNPNTQFNYFLPEAGIVTFKIFNLKGQMVDEIVDHGVAGSNHVNWDASGKASGVYMIHMEAENFTSMRKAVLLK